VNFVECPTCRQKTNKKFEELPKNRMIIQFMELQNSNQMPNFQQQVPPTVPPYPVDNNTHNSNFASSSTVEIPVYHHDEYNANNNNNWDERRYYLEIFQEIDHNNDGEINFQELHQALKKGNPFNSEFDPKTAKLLLSKYDRDNDDEINFDEFYNLFQGINLQFNEFLDIDKDSSGTIDSSELASYLHKKGYKFSKSFYDYLMFELSKLMHNNNGVSFDLYVRVIAKIDYLRTQFNHRYHKNDGNLEEYVKQNFFIHF